MRKRVFKMRPTHASDGRGKRFLFFCRIPYCRRRARKEGEKVIWQNKLTDGTGVAGEGFSGRSPGIAHDQDVGSAVLTRAEGILENTARFENDFRVVTRGLSRGASIKVPFGEGVNALGLQRSRKGKKINKWQNSIDYNILVRIKLAVAKTSRCVF
jgi:hypothetical protein